MKKEPPLPVPKKVPNLKKIDFKNSTKEQIQEYIAKMAENYWNRPRRRQSKKSKKPTKNKVQKSPKKDRKNNKF